MAGPQRRRGRHAGIFYAGSDVDRSIDAIESLGGKLKGRATIDNTLHVAGFDLPGSRFADIARLPGAARQRSFEFADDPPRTLAACRFRAAY